MVDGLWMHSSDWSVARNVVVSVVIQAATIAAATVLDAIGFSESTIVLVFVLGVLLTALFTSGRVYCLVASVLSILSFNYFLVAPRFSFRMDGPDVPGTIAVMFVVAMVASYLVTQMRESMNASAQAKLVAQNEQLRSTLLRSVSHDLRTPLTSISGNAEVLLDVDARLGDADRRRLIQDIYDDATWLTGIVENLLSVTRVEEGGVSLDTEPELVDDLVEEAMRHVSRDAATHDLRVCPSDELMLVRVDAQMIVQVLVNLVNNAIMHTDRGSLIVISSERVGDNAVISVIDDGPGVHKVDADLLFEPYFSMGRSASDGRRGIGLGLSLCRTIVEMHGGNMEVANLEPHGAKFSFSLPLEEVPAHG